MIITPYLPCLLRIRVTLYHDSGGGHIVVGSIHTSSAQSILIYNSHNLIMKYEFSLNYIIIQLLHKFINNYTTDEHV